MYDQLLAVVETFNKYVQKDCKPNVCDPLDRELFSLLKTKLGFSGEGNSIKIPGIEISICKGDATEILSCISSAYSQLQINEEDDYRLLGLPDPEGLTLTLLKWMGIECMDKEINEALDGAIF